MIKHALALASALRLSYLLVILLLIIVGIGQVDKEVFAKNWLDVLKDNWGGLRNYVSNSLNPESEAQGGPRLDAPPKTSAEKTITDLLKSPVSKSDNSARQNQGGPRQAAPFNLPLPQGEKSPSAALPAKPAPKASLKSLTPSRPTVEAEQPKGPGTAKTLTPKEKLISQKLTKDLISPSVLKDLTFLGTIDFSQATVTGLPPTVINNYQATSPALPVFNQLTKNTDNQTVLSAQRGGFTYTLSVGDDLSVGRNVTIGTADRLGSLTINGQVILGSPTQVSTVTLNSRLSSTLNPNVNNSLDLGSFDLAWRDLYASGTTRLNTLITTGSVTLGDDATSDTLTLNSRLTSSILPSTNNTLDLGAFSNAWKNIFASGTIRTTDLILTGSCTGCPSGGGGGGVSSTAFTTPATVTNGTTTSSLRADGLFIATSTANLLGLFNVDSSGNVNASGTLTLAGNLLPRSTPSASSTTQMTSSTLDNLDFFAGGGSETAMTLSNDGTPVITYFTASFVRVIKCTEAACGAGAGAARSNIDYLFAGGRPGMAIGTDGFPIVSYRQSPGVNLTVTKCGNAACSSGNSSTTLATGAGSGNSIDSSLAIGSDGFPVIAYIHYITQALRIAKCGNAACSSGNTITQLHDTGGTPQMRPAIAIGTDGRPIVVFTDNNNGNLLVIKCGNAACSSGNTTSTVELSPGGNVDFPSIAIGTDGLPVISYFVNTLNDLRVAKCGNSACSSGNTTTTIDSTGTVGQDNSLAIGADGLPIISYQYQAANALTVAKCGNPSCTSGNTTTTVASGSSSSFARRTQIAIGNDGLPVIGFVRETGDPDALTVIKCADPACKNTAGGSLLPGSDLGTRGVFFNNVFASQFWGKRFQIANFDLAEDYPTQDQTLGAGELIAIDPEHEGFVKRADASLPKIIGVVSTQPGLLLSNWTAQENIKNVPVALAGRVPVKVTAENGPIQPGDFLTLSPTMPGAAAKAVKAGRIIGSALAYFNSPDPGTIPVMVSLGNLNQDATTPLTVALTNNNQLLTSDLDLNNQSLLQVSAINSNQNPWSIDSAGRLLVKEIKTDKLQTKQLVIEANADPLQSAIGQTTIPAGQSSVEVKNNLVKPTTKIFITFRNNPDSFWWINKQTAGAFELSLGAPAPTDLIFDYWIIDTVKNLAQSLSGELIKLINQPASSTEITSSTER